MVPRSFGLAIGRGFAAVGLMVLSTASAAVAQDLDGRDTAGNWRVTEYETHGVWKTICDEREEPSGLHQRCYVRWVDVYTQTPKLGALFAFVTPDGASDRIQFGPEPGSVFLPGGFQIRRGDDIVWVQDDRQCLLWAQCDFDAESSSAVLREMRAGGVLELRFEDRSGARYALRWPLDAFSAAFDSYRAHWAKRQ